MTAIFSDFFRAQLFANQTMMDSAVIKAVLFRQSPDFTVNDPRYTTAKTVAELLTKQGWVESAGTGYPLTNSIVVGVRIVANGRYVVFTNFPFTGMSPAEATAIGFYISGTVGGQVDPLIFVSNTPFLQREVVKDGDGVTAQPDPALSGASNRWLFSWAVPTAGATTVNPGEGPLALTKGAASFEVSHTQHVWLYPQRANMIANPSFEAPGTNFWSTNGSITRVQEGAPGGGAWAGRFTGPGPTVAESNAFLTGPEEYWTIQFMAKGNGDCKVGFVWWTDEFIEVAVDWGTERWTLQPDAWTHIAVCRAPVNVYQGMLRVECAGSSLTIDRVLVEKGFLKDWQYFDGDSTYGARGDFTWYGGESRQGQSYSLWYNNKKAIYGRLFARNIDDDTLVTDEVLAEQGIVYQWVPAGTVVVAHTDVLYPHDLQAPIPPKLSGVLPYRVDPITDLQGVLNPWV